VSRLETDHFPTRHVIDTSFISTANQVRRLSLGSILLALGGNDAWTNKAAGEVRTSRVEVRSGGKELSLDCEHTVYDAPLLTQYAREPHTASAWPPIIRMYARTCACRSS